MNRIIRTFALALLTGHLALAQTAPAAVAPGSVTQAIRRPITIGGDLGQWAGLPQERVILSNGVPSVPVKNSGYYSLAYDNRCPRLERVPLMLSSR